MYEFIKGQISELTPAYVIIEISGIGYFINISLQTYSQLTNKNEAKVLLHYIVREDAHLFFGFADEEERYVFRLLLSVNGIGANTARMILSSLTSLEIRSAIENDDTNKLKSVKGVGLKTAQRIIVDLKDKISKTAAGQGIFTQNNNTIHNEAVSALINLGFAKLAVEKTIDGLLRKNNSLSLESLIKQALKQL